MDGAAFAGFENLTGAAGNKDTFNFAATGTLSGLVDGGAGGYDVVSIASDGSAVVSTITGPQSGTIARSGDVVTYAGMEPVAVSGTTKVTVTANTDSLSINVTDDGAPANGAFTVDPTPSGEATLVTSSVAGPVDLTINLHGGTNTIHVHNMDTAYGGTIHLNGASGADTFDLHDLTGYTGAITITGNGGNDVYKLGDAFGNVTITDAAAADKLDFTGRTNPLTVDASKNFGSSDGSSLTQQTGTAGSIDVTFGSSPGPDIKAVVGDLSVGRLEPAVGGGRAQQPHTVPARVTHRRSAVERREHRRLRDQALDHLVGCHGRRTQLDDARRDRVGLERDQLAGLAARHRYDGLPRSRDERSHEPVHLRLPLEVLLDLKVPTQTLTNMVGIDLGALGSNLGVSFSGTPQITLTTHYSLDLRIGASTDRAPTVFLDPGLEAPRRHLRRPPARACTTSPSTSASSARRSTTLPRSRSPAGSTRPRRPERRRADHRGELTSTGEPSLVLSDNPVSSLTGTLTLEIQRSRSSGGGSLASGTLSFSLTGSIFGGQGAAPNVSVNVTTSPSIPDLLDKFKNIGPSDVLGMLNQVLGLLSSMASSSAVNLPIPFTNLTLGTALDYATSFKRQVLDPLFKSGDAFKPDANGDGSVNAADINFSSVQDFLDRLAVGIGLAPGTLTATSTGTGELTFPFSFDTNLGFGTPVVVSRRPARPS